MALKDLQIFPFKDEDRFEEFCLVLWKKFLNDHNTQLNGRRGQRQQGVDLFGRRNGIGTWVGVQCKVRTGGVLTENEIKEDVKNAKDFNPRLSELVFATTAKRDANLQETVRLLSEQNMKDGYFPINVFSWDDIELALAEERNFDICKRFYGDFFINYENMGIAIFRILRISIGIDTPDTSYEILLGKTPPADGPEACFGLNYWRGIYFIANLNDRKIETFCLPVDESDFEDSKIFLTRRDAYIIAEWLNGLKSLDDLLYGVADEHVKLISRDEYEVFRLSLKDN